MNTIIKNLIEKSLKTIASNPETISFSLLTSQLTCPKLKIKPPVVEEMLKELLNGLFITILQTIIHDLKIQIVWKGIKPSGLKISI